MEMVKLSGSFMKTRMINADSLMRTNWNRAAGSACTHQVAAVAAYIHYCTRLAAHSESQIGHEVKHAVLLMQG